MARKTKEEAEKTRLAIIRAAEDLFYNFGVACTSLHDIAVAAGVTRGAFYWHFKDKADLLRTIADEVFLPHEELLDRLVSEDNDDPLNILYKHCISSVNAIVNDPRRRRVFTILVLRCEYNEEMDVLKARNSACRDRVLARLVTLFTAAKRKSKLAPPWEPETAAQALHSMIYGFVHMEMEWDKPSRKRDQARNAAFSAFFQSVQCC